MLGRRLGVVFCQLEEWEKGGGDLKWWKYKRWRGKQEDSGIGRKLAKGEGSGGIFSVFGDSSRRDSTLGSLTHSSSFGVTVKRD